MRGLAQKRHKGGILIEALLAAAIGLPLLLLGYQFYIVMLRQVERSHYEIDLLQSFEMVEVILRQQLETAPFVFHCPQKYEDASYLSLPTTISYSDEITSFEASFLKNPWQIFTFEEENEKNGDGLLRGRATSDRLLPFYGGKKRWLAKESDLLLLTFYKPVAYFKRTSLPSYTELNEKIATALNQSAKQIPLFFLSDCEEGYLFRASKHKAATPPSSPSSGGGTEEWLLPKDYAAIINLYERAKSDFPPPLFLYQVMTEQLYIGEEKGQSYLIYDGMDGLAFIRIPHILRFRLAFYDEDFKKIKSEDKSSKADFILAEVVAGIGPWQERAVPYRYQFLPLLLESGGERIISYTPRLVDSRFFLIKLPDYSAFSVKEP